MKRKILIIAAVVGVLAILGGGVWYFCFNRSADSGFERGEDGRIIIPDGHLTVITHNLSPMDGPATSYYVYEDRIIKTYNQSFPLGYRSYTHERIVTLYSDLSPEFIQDFIQSEGTEVELPDGVVIEHIQE